MNTQLNIIRFFFSFYAIRNKVYSYKSIKLLSNIFYACENLNNLAIIKPKFYLLFKPSL